MSDKAFLDTNILIYLYSEDDEIKRSTAYSIINSYACVTSIQAFNEACNVWFKKFGWSASKIEEHLDNIAKVCDDVLPVHRVTVNKAVTLKNRYGFSFYDCLMLTSALDSGCQIIFTEDMRNSQIVESTLKIVNPFA